MTIQDNLNRIQQAKSDIKAAIESKGVYVDEIECTTIDAENLKCKKLCAHDIKLSKKCEIDVIEYSGTLDLENGCVVKEIIKL